MIKTFPIEFVNKIITQTLFTEKLKNEEYFGGENEIQIFSFYEQLLKDDEVDRFVQAYQDLVDQQNRTNLIGNGVIVSPTNPTITNLYSALIIPLEFSLNIRVNLANRDKMLFTFYNLIEELKGRKIDVAQLKTTDMFGSLVYVPFKVGTIGEENGENIGEVVSGDFILDTDTTNVNTPIVDKLNELTTMGIQNNLVIGDYLYYAYHSLGTTQLRVAVKTSNGWVDQLESDEYPDIVFPPNHTDMEKFKVSIAFESIRCSEPRTLNEEEYCDITFGGSATVVNNGVKLGNDLIRVGISAYKIIKQTPTTYLLDYYYLEPLELPNGNSANTQINALISNNFKNNTHTDALNVSLQYTFIVDENNEFLRQLFLYSRYGEISGLITPNMIYKVQELWSSWGVVVVKTFNAKIIESVDGENTEGDVLTLTLPLQIQGDNN